MKNCNSCKKCCCGAWLMYALLIIGGLNWGLVGIGLFTGGNLNVVNLIFGKVVWLEAVIYFLVALSALVMMFGGCRCKKCKGGKCDTDASCKACEGGVCDTHMKKEGEMDM